jgi:protein-S-isoprenylcysteine O-methyltransferase Ste14
VEADFRKPKIYPMAWLVLAAMAIYALDRWFPILQIMGPPIHWIGLLFAVPGVLILLQAGRAFIRAKTGLLPFSESTTLVTGGLYRFTRNPMYLGMVLFLLGLALFSGSLSSLIPVGLFTWIIDRQFIRNEEIFLTEIFGVEYLDYKKRVRRWI